MATAAQVTALIKADDTQFQQTLKKNRDDVDKQGSFFKNAFSGLIGVAGGMLAAAGIQFGIGQIISTFSGWVQGATQAAQAQAVMNARLLSTKDAVGLSAAQINAMVQSLKDFNGVDDDTIMQATNLLLTFTNIGKSVFPLANQAALDLAYGLAKTNGAQVDLSSASIMLGKALQDPVAGITALHKVGIDLSDAQKKQIKSFMDVNDVADAQKVILQEVEKEMGHAAQAAGNTDPLNKFKIAWGDIGKQIGGDLLPVIQNLSDNVLMPMATWIQDHLNPALDAMGGFLKSLGDDFSRAFNDPNGEKVAKLRDLAHDLLTKFQDLGGWTKDHLTPVLHDMFTALGDITDWISNSKQHFDDVKQWWKDWGGLITGAASAITVWFIPAMIAAATTATTKSAVIAATWIANIVKAGLTSFTSAGQMWFNTFSFVEAMIVTAATGVVQGTKLAATWIAQIIATGAQAVWAAGKMTVEFIAAMGKVIATAIVDGAILYATWIASIIATGTQAVWAAGKMTVDFIGGMLKVGGQAGVTAGEVDGLAAAETSAGTAGSGAIGVAGAGAAAGIGILGLAGAIAFLYYWTGQATGAFGGWLGLQFKHWFDDMIGYIQTLIGWIKDLIDWIGKIHLGSVSPPPSSGSWGGPGVKAAGGPVNAMTPYIVGDGGGPELFVPDRPGTIIPARQTQQMLNGGSGGNTYYYISGPTTETMMRQLNAAKQREQSMVFGGRR